MKRLHEELGGSKERCLRGKAGEVLPYLLLTVLGLFLVFYGRPEGSLYGSMLDWISQHSVLPEYFRQAFYASGDLFPDFAMELGGGQNIYHFSYYGLYNPLIMISWLFPRLSMETWLAVVSVASVLGAALLFYRCIQGRTTSRAAAFFSSVSFLCAAPLLFHSHRHLMFVSYMPFLLLGILGVDRYFAKGRKDLICIGMLLCFLTSYFFSPGCALALLLYAFYQGWTREEASAPRAEESGVGTLVGRRLRGLLSPVLTVGLSILVAAAMAGILLIPTAYTLFIGREEGAAQAGSLWDLLIPAFEPKWLMGSTYSLGLTFFALIALVFGCISRKKAQRGLAVTLILLLVIPIFTYVLNGTLYVRPKALIPFLPLYCLLIAQMIEGLVGWARSKKRLELPGKKGRAAHAGAVSLVCLLCTLLFLSSLATCMQAGKGEQWVMDETLEKIRAADKEALLHSANRKEEGSGIFYRSDDLTHTSFTMNRTYGGAARRTSVYSSVASKGYNAFFYDVLENPISSRNRTACVTAPNPFFQMFMGVRYLTVSGRAVPPAGYEKVSEKNGVALYKNEAVLPLGWMETRVMGLEDFRELAFPQTVQPLFERVIVEEGDSSDAATQEPQAVSQEWFEKLDPWPCLAQAEKKKNVTITPIKPSQRDDGHVALEIQAKKDASLEIPLPGPLEDRILVIQFQISDQKNRRSLDTSVTINGIKNKLSKRSAAYPNENYQFVYAVSSADTVDKLLVEFSQGVYEIYNLQVSCTRYSYLKEACANREALYVRDGKTGPDHLEGTVNAGEGGYLVTTLPFDKGFHVTVDGEEAVCERVNTAFLGVPLSRGVHEIQIDYRAPGKTLGMAATALGLLAFCVYCLPLRRLWREKRELWSYLFFGVLTTLVNWGVFQALSAGLSTTWELANVVSWAAAVVFAYGTNRRFVFQSRVKGRAALTEFFRFVQCRLLSLLMDMAAMFLLIDIIGMAPFPAKVLTGVLVVAANYGFSKLFIFRNPANKGGI